MNLVCDEIAKLGEGPIWDAEKKCLWWIDIIGKKLHRFTPSDNTNLTFELPQKPGTVVIGDNGKLCLALVNGFYSFDPETKDCKFIGDPESDNSATRFNDGKCDPAGRFWAGTMEDAETGLKIGSLYSLQDGKCMKHFSDVGISNGIVWNSRKDKMFYIDSPTRTVSGFDYDLDSGKLSNRSDVFVFDSEHGFPDGMAIDSQDNLWIGMWGGWKIVRIDPESKSIISEIPVPARNVTACAFGGDDLMDLYITTARHGNDETSLDEQPNAGGLFKTRVDVVGTTFAKFKS